MEIRQGIVRNYVVTDREKFCDAMASSLCKMGISYVQIENEFHFDDKIYRFFNFGEAIELDELVTFVCLDREKVLTLSPSEFLFVRDQEDLGRMLDPLGQEVFRETEHVDYEEDKRKNFGNQKQLRKHDNKMVNQRIKNSYKQQGFRTRRNG